MTSPGFYGLGIAPSLLTAIERLGFTTPTPIQEKAIPIAVEGKDLIGIAQTGTGKTIAFGVPVIQRLAQVKGRALIILPTRELALQVDEALLKVGRGIGLRSAVLIGGASMIQQIRQLGKSPHLLIATPGRLLDHLEQKSVRLGDIRILVLDEADRMLDMGFAPQINRILGVLPRERQTMLFSATMPDGIVRIATGHMKLPVRVEIARSGTAAERVSHELFVVEKSQKLRLLERTLGEYRGTVLVFTRTKFTAKRATRAVKGMGHSAAEIHSNRSLGQRRDALDGFKAGRYRVLVATDIAARGIDVTGIELVLNFDLPQDALDYVHRIGRTGRAGHAGHAISFATPDQMHDVRSIERLIRTTLRQSPLPPLPPERAIPLPHRGAAGYRTPSSRQSHSARRTPGRPYGRQAQRRGRSSSPRRFHWAS